MQVIYYRASPKREWVIIYISQGAISSHSIQYIWKDSKQLTGEIALVQANNTLASSRWTLKFRKGEARVYWRGRLKSCFPNKWERIQLGGRKVWRPINERQCKFQWKEKI